MPSNKRIYLIILVIYLILISPIISYLYIGSFKNLVDKIIFKKQTTNVVSPTPEELEALEKMSETNKKVKVLPLTAKLGYVVYKEDYFESGYNLGGESGMLVKASIKEVDLENSKMKVLGLAPTKLPWVGKEQEVSFDCSYAYILKLNSNVPLDDNGYPKLDNDTYGTGLRIHEKELNNIKFNLEDELKPNRRIDFFCLNEDCSQVGGMCKMYEIVK